MDLSPAASEDEVQRLLAELLDSEGEDQVALRDGQRYVARLVRGGPKASPEGVQLIAEATYLITGGLGGLGLKVAQWLVAHGARHLVLVGRSGAASEQAQAVVEELEQAGVQVLVGKADVAEAAQMQAVFTQMQAGMPVLRGVVHAAGVLDDGILLHQNWARFAPVLSPKVAGGWALHELTRDVELDFFVLFSSVSALLGSAGQSNYASANAFLDGLAHYRRAHGLAGMSINWGPWAEVGLAARQGLAEQITARGLELIRPEAGLEVLGQLLGSKAVRVGVMQADWPATLASFTGNTPPFLREMAREHPSAEVESRPEIRLLLESAPQEKRAKLLVEHVREQVAKVMGFEPLQLADPTQGFFDLGMDSLMTVALRNNLEQSLGCTLPATLAFDYPSIDAIVRYLGKEVLGYVPLAPDPIDEQVIGQAELVDAIKGLPEDELEALVNRELNKFKEN